MKKTIDQQRELLRLLMASLVESRKPGASRAQSVLSAVTLLRKLTVDQVRAEVSQARKRGADPGAGSRSLVAFDEALTELARVDERKATVTELGFYGGLSTEEIADVLGITLADANREWSEGRTGVLQLLATSILKQG